MVLVGKVKKGLQWYLSKVGFKLSSNTRYLKRNLTDIVLSFVYSAISVGCVVMDKASLLVFFLNSLCMCRVIIRNTIESSKLTNILNKELQDETSNQSVTSNNMNLGKFYPYRKGIGQIVITAFSHIVIIIAFYDASMLIPKFLTSTLIIFVWLDDVECSLVNMWSGVISPFNREKRGSE